MRGKRGDYPDGLTADMVGRWMSGRTSSAKKAHIDWVVRAWSDYRPPAKEDAGTPEKLKLTAADFALIQAEAKRTGLGAVDILRHAPKPLPDGLNHQKVHRWIAGETHTAIKAHWELVIALYASISTQHSEVR